jgi:hypothetical protein
MKLSSLKYSFPFRKPHKKKIMNKILLTGGPYHNQYWSTTSIDLITTLINVNGVKGYYAKIGREKGKSIVKWHSEEFW